MDKNAIKRFATQARRELIERVSQKATEYGIEEKNIVPGFADSVNGRVLTADEKKQRQGLIQQIQEDGYEQVMEEVAYTWFNRFCALRFMEVNNYLPSRVRVFTDEENHLNPQILAEAIHMELSGLDLNKVYAYKEANQEEELYKYLLITQCNALSAILPGMFERISDYTELLLPDHLLREGSVIEQMITLIPEEDWQDAVQIIGWLYQYYNSQKKDEVFAALKKNVKITKNNIPAATQLFTPDWIVRYMVENSLGRLWVEGHPNEELKGNWKYYLEEAEQEPEVQAQLDEIRKVYAEMSPEDIKVIDPCCGSGHILAYMFDVLMQIYESQGYTSREAVSSIVRNNIYGLDIDDRAAQLAYFSVMMKARQYDRRFFSHTQQPHVYAICESNHLDTHALEYFCNEDEKLTTAMKTIQKELYDAKEYGSILTVSNQDWDALYTRFDEVFDDISMHREVVLNQLLPLVQVAAAMAQKYHVTITNPPYMGGSGMTSKLSDYVKKNYPDSKADLFAVFIEKCGLMNSRNGYQAMITQHSWMFLSSFEKLREKIIGKDIINMAHLGARAFEEIAGEVVQTTSFVMQNTNTVVRKGTYLRLVDGTNAISKMTMFFNHDCRHHVQQCNFAKIPGCPVAYWVGPAVFKSFMQLKPISAIGDAKAGMTTGDNNRFLRLWPEVPFNEIGLNKKNKEEAQQSLCTWFPYNKGGGVRKWYGLNEYVVLWKNDGYEIKNAEDHGRKIASVRSERLYFKKSITWATLTSGMISCRYSEEGHLFDDKGSSCFMPDKAFNYALTLINSCVGDYFLHILNPTMSFQSGNIGALPVKEEYFEQRNISSLSCESVEVSKEDWDSFEISWDFVCDPLIKLKKQMKFTVTEGCNSNKSYFITGSYLAWKGECEDRFQALKSNEEELNRIFIDIYGLQDELTPEVEDKDVTVYRIFDSKDDIPESMGSSRYALTKQDVVKNFISYAVGCMFGRYTLDKQGLVYAGGEFDDTYRKDRLLPGITFGGDNISLGGNYTYVKDGDDWKELSFPVDADNIIPISDDEYFPDDIVGRFEKFVSTVYGEDTLAENMKFIADALGGKGQPRDVIRNYFLNDFYKDHCRMYQKRPIYWLFDSGKKNGFKALIYMHRYQPDTIARIRTDYVHEQQGRYRTAIADLQTQVDNASAGNRVKLQKSLTKLKDQEAELRTYEEKIHHLADQMISIDLDDGVKHNYEIFQDVLAKIK